MVFVLVGVDVFDFCSFEGWFEYSEGGEERRGGLSFVLYMS